MKHQEIYAWSSLLSSVALLGYYLVAVFGWPGNFESNSVEIANIFWQIIGIVILIELVLGFVKHFKLEPEKDERDQKIASKSYSNAYYFLMVAIAALVVHGMIADFVSVSADQQPFLAQPFMTFHLLVIILFTARIVKTCTQLYYYRLTNQRERIMDSKI